MSGLREPPGVSNREDCRLCVGLGSNGRGNSTIGRGGTLYECNWSLGCRSWCGYALIGSAVVPENMATKSNAGSEEVQRAESGMEGHAGKTEMQVEVGRWPSWLIVSVMER